MPRKLTHALVLTAAAGAAFAPAASAMIPGPSLRRQTPPPQPVVVKSVESGGFHYGDAAIGAGAAIVVLSAGAGGKLVSRRARRPQLSRAAGA